MKQVKEVITSPADLLSKYPPGISAGEIHLWACRLDPGAELLQVFENSLPDVERQRISFFSFQKDQVGYTTSQGFLRMLLAHYISIDAKDVLITRQRKGKPYLLNDTSLLFNISNSGEYVIVAVSRHGEVGIDFEKIRPLDDFNDLVQKNFSPKEKEYINKVPADKLYRFFKLWTLKEAFLKAIGEGMRLTPDNLEFLMDNGTFKLNTGPGFYEFDGWQFSDIAIVSNHVGTLAHQKNPAFISEIRYI